MVVVVVGGGVVVVGATDVVVGVGVVVGAWLVVVGGAVVVVGGGLGVLVGWVEVGRAVGWPNRLPMLVPLFPPDNGPWLSSSIPVTAPMPITNASNVKAAAIRHRSRRGSSAGGRSLGSASGSSVRDTRDRTR